MNVFLRAKHWQLFLLMVSLPLIYDLLIFNDIPLGYARKHQNYTVYISVLAALFMAVSYAWIWAVGVNLQHKIPYQIKMNVRRFKIFFFVPLAYVSSIMLFMAVGRYYSLSDIGQYETPFLIGMISFVCFHLLSLFCMCYCIHFVAKTLKTIEMQRENKFSDLAGEFFLIWFYPVGIWFIQPRVNKLVEERGDTDALNL